MHTRDSLPAWCHYSNLYITAKTHKKPSPSHPNPFLSRIDRKKDKNERKILDSQERAFWDVHRPVVSQLANANAGFISWRSEAQTPPTAEAGMAPSVKYHSHRAGGPQSSLTAIEWGPPV